MYNYVTLIGRLVKKPEIKVLDDGRRVANVRIAVSRSFKNSNGEIETDFFNISFWEFLVDFIDDNLDKGSAVFIKGRLQTQTQELANGYSIATPVIIGEKILSFSSELKNIKLPVSLDE